MSTFFGVIVPIFVYIVYVSGLGITNLSKSSNKSNDTRPSTFSGNFKLFVKTKPKSNVPLNLSGNTRPSAFLYITCL